MQSSTLAELVDRDHFSFDSSSMFNLTIAQQSEDPVVKFRILRPVPDAWDLLTKTSMTWLQ